MRTIQRRHYCQVLGCDYLFAATTIAEHNKILVAHYREHHPREILTTKRWAYAVADRGPHYTRGSRYALAWGEFARRTYAEGQYWSGSTDPVGDFAPLPPEGRSVPHFDIPETRVFDTHQEAVDDFVAAQQARIEKLRNELLRAESDLVSFLLDKPSEERTRDDRAIFEPKGAVE